MTYTFDEAFKCVKENSFIQSYEDIYEYNHVIDLDDVIEILENLEQEYAPTVEMTKEQYKGLLFEGKGRETPHKNFLFMKNVQKLNSKNINISILMSAFAHPETIKVVDE